MREKPRDSGRLRHMLHAMENINRFVADKTLDDFAVDSLLYYAVIKNLEIIGEAAYMLTAEFKETHQLTPWNQIVGMRHFLVHGYYQIDSHEVWNTIQQDLQPLRIQLSQYLEELD